ncbi:AcrR family transcriptional regulator [Actinoplanes lutulentus]|uniref:TetR family transcriptional regulator n=1 Tax=Actinoplanes lutulentus TaxID=1287878 RepID=A0A327ZPI0_9ACTN|nr:TetR/AcrR family transcriptional regulator [Actinoplanes lutulentus]MBB2944219.1 AcrR family transcriptional regulator [Actinoplanes lutulentus]RAK42548.1 TetR family transcriptional regulator [Actinoplanes lutulentus]
MPRPTRQQIDDEILDAAASLFARHGFRETSIQRIADTVGYSKTGLLHRFPNKEALQHAVIERCVNQVRDIATGVSDLPVGPERDRAVITAVAQLALAQPGVVALLLSSLVSEPESEMGQALREIGEAITAAFGEEFLCDPPRALRKVGALGAIAVASVALRDVLSPDAMAGLVEVGCNALGHPSVTH